MLSRGRGSLYDVAGSSHGDGVGRGAPDGLLVDGHVRAVRHVGRGHRFAGQAPAVVASGAAVRDVLVAAAALVAEQLLQAHDGGQGQRQLGDDQRLAGQQGEHAERQRYGHAAHHERVHEHRVVLVALFTTFINSTREKLKKLLKKIIARVWFGKIIV